MPATPAASDRTANHGGPREVLDRLAAATDAVGFATDLDRQQFYASWLHQAAVIRCLTVIGEAATKISREFRESHAEIEWRDIVGMRHRLVHNYAAINTNVVWGTLRDKLPDLIAALTPLVPPSDDTGSA